MPDSPPPTPLAEAASALLQPPPPSMADQKADDPFYEPNGFLNLQGQQAVEHSVPTQRWLKDRVDELVKSEPEGPSRDTLRLQLQQLYANDHAHIEEHTARQVEAGIKATNEANLAATRTAVTLNPEDDAAAALQYAKSVDSATHGALSPQDKAAREQAWHGVLAEDRLTALIDKGDWTKAEEVLKDNRAALGVKVKPYEVKIQGHKVQVEAQTTAGAFVNAALDKATGTVDEAKLNGLLETVAPEKRKLVTEVAKEAQGRVEHAAEQQRKQTATEAFKKVNVQGFWSVPPDVRSQLNNSDPALYDRLKNEADRRFRERNKSDAEARREQTALAKQAHDDFLSLTPEQRVDQDLGKFLAGRGLDKPDRVASQLGVLKEAAQQSVDKGLSVHESSFVDHSLKSVDKVVTGKAKIATFRAMASLAYQQFVEKNKRPPSLEEEAEVRAPLINKVIKPGFLWDSEQLGYEAMAEKQRAGIKNGTPAPSAAKPPKVDRAKALKAKGLTNKAIADTLNSEGY